MRRTHLVGVVLLGLALGSVAVAEDFEDFLQFRYISGLPGSGYGVTPKGTVGFAGALQMNIPVGYALSSGNYVLAGHTSAVNGGFPTSFSGDDANGTLTIGVGFGPAGGGLYGGVMNTGAANWGEPAYNLQWQFLSETASRPGVSVGVVDLLNMRPEKRSRMFEGGGRSFFAAATWSRGSEEHPTFWTLGLGDGRFNDRLFGGVSYQWTDRLKVCAEYDGWNPNVGAAWDAWRDDEWHGVVLLGVTDLDRVTFGATITRQPE